jgi:hypothetical protein
MASLLARQTDQGDQSAAESTENQGDKLIFLNRSSVKGSELLHPWLEHQQARTHQQALPGSVNFALPEPKPHLAQDGSWTQKAGQNKKYSIN